MGLEQGKLGYSQLLLLMIGYIIGPSIILVPAANAGQDAWIAILLSIIEGLILFLASMVLSGRFKGKNLVQINEIVYGPYISKLISIAYLWFLFHVASLILTTFKDFFLVTTLPRTPSLAIMMIIMLVCAYAVKNGIEVIARCGQILVVVSIVSSFLSSMFLLEKFSIENLFPMFEISLKNLLIEAHGAATFLYGDMVVFLMIIPCLNHISGRRIYKWVAMAFLLGGLFIAIISIRNIATLGMMTKINLYPTFQADRLINIGNLLTRLEIFTVTGFLTMGFINFSTLLYATVLGGAELFGLRSYRPLILPIGILMVLVALMNFKNITGVTLFARQIFPIYSLPFQVGLPLLTLIIALVRGLPKR